MNDNFDFSKIGKRMPYTTPEGFFDRMEDNVLAAISDGSTAAQAPATANVSTRPASRIRRFVTYAAGIAAAAAIAFVAASRTDSQQTVTDSDVDRAFSQLTAADQNYLISVYQSDVFIAE